MIDHDRLFKELLRRFFLEFLALFLPELSDALEPGSVDFLDKQVFTDVTTGDKHEADLVAKARLHGEEAFFLFHVEHQASAQSVFGRRMFRYFARLHEEHGLRIYPVAIFSYDKPRRPEPDTYEITVAGREVLRFHYHVIQLNRLSWRHYVNNPNPVASALMSKMQIAPADRAKVKVQCLRLMTTLRLNRARMQLIAGFVDTYLRLNDVEQQQFQEELTALEPRSRKVAMDIMTSWEEKGLQQGLHQGLAQGRQQEALAFVRRLLRSRVGTLSRTTAARLRRLPVAALEDLGEALLSFNEAREVEAWLEHRAREAP